MRASIAALALCALVVPGGSGAGPTRASVDIFITASVAGRVRGANAASVDVRWDFKCFGDRLGEATYRWTLAAVRLLPRPQRVVTLLQGTSKSGSTRARFTPGRYQLQADPFRCETSRGAGWTEPEIGAQFVVPDYCSWSVARVSGRATVERARALRPVRRRELVRPGDVVVTGAGGSVRLVSREGGSEVALASGSRGRVEPRRCGRRGGWRIDLTRGVVRSRLAEADRRPVYEIATPNVVSRAGRAAWTVRTGRRGGAAWSRVSVQSGTVVVRRVGGGRATRLGPGMAIDTRAS